ncbi:MAG: hypothetical protein V2A69_14130 [Pseudomonadota bacterium]
MSRTPLAPRLLSRLRIKHSVTTAPARLDSRPVANGYLDRLPTYKTMWPCQAATKGVPIHAYELALSSLSPL